VVLATCAWLCTAAGGAPTDPAIERAIDAMSDDEKIAQLLFVDVPGPIDSLELRRLVAERRVGGVVLYAYNMESPDQVKRLTEAIRAHAAGGTTPFIATDQEGGIVRRLRLGVPVLPSAMALGATRSPELSRRAGAAVGTALRELGFNMNFAPVLDVLTSAENASIGTRAFSDDPKVVADLGAAFVEGQQSAGVIAVAKHFPGIGGVAEDTHKALPRLDASREQLSRRELLPFRRAIEHGLAAVMTGHIALPRVTESPGLPATLSTRVMTTLLRKEMHFEGIAITDALQMDALARERGYGALALDALQAGSDMVISIGRDKQAQAVYDDLRAAYRDGRLPKARVRESLRRILTAKAMLKRGSFASQKADGIIEEIARRAVTRVARADTKLPAIADVSGSLVYVGPDGPLRTTLAPRNAVSLPSRPATESTQLSGTIAAAMHNAALCIAAAETQEQFEVIRRAHEARPQTPLIFVNLGSPHRILRGPRALTLLTYGEDARSQIAVARVILGEEKAQGVLPVTLHESTGASDTAHRESVPAPGGTSRE
jgi:beta-glucosidase-like glycosyl hydrolase